MKIASILLVILPFIKPAITDVNSNVSIVTPQEIDNPIILKCNIIANLFLSPQATLSHFLYAYHFEENPSCKTSFEICKVNDKETIKNGMCCVGNRIGNYVYDYGGENIIDSVYNNTVCKDRDNFFCVDFSGYLPSWWLLDIMNCCKTTDPRTPCSNFKLIKVKHKKKKEICVALLKDKTCLKIVDFERGKEYVTDFDLGSFQISFVKVLYKEPINKNKDSQEEKIIEVETNKEEN